MRAGEAQSAAPSLVRPRSGNHVEEAAAGEQHDQQDGEQEARQGIADQHRRRWSPRRSGCRRAPPWRCREGWRRYTPAAWTTDRARCDTGSFCRISCSTRLVAKEAAAEVEAQIAADHVDEAGQRRLVEAEHLLDVGDDVRVEAARAAIGAGRTEIRCGRAQAADERSPLPRSSAIICSTGPPGANWMTAKLMAMMPNSVGMTSSRRRKVGGHRITLRR